MDFNKVLTILGVVTNTMHNNLTVFLGEEAKAPYEFSVSTGILGGVNPIIYGHTLKSNEIQEIFPGIIEQWDFDFKNTYTLTVGNHNFHNGRKITAYDIEFSIVRGFISKSPNYNRIHFSDISGVEKLAIGQKFQRGLADGIKVTDDKTIKIKLKNNNPIFLLNFTIPFAPIVPIEELCDDYYTWKSKPIGAGPYKIIKDFKDHTLILEKTRNDLPGPKRIEFHTKRILPVYDILFDGAIATAEEQNHKKNISDFPGSLTSLYFFRDNELSKNINFRKTVFYAINRQAAIQNSEILKPADKFIARPYIFNSSKNTENNEKKLSAFIKSLPKDYFDREILIGVFSSTNDFPNVLKKQIESISNDLSKTGLKFKFEPISEKFPTPEIMKRYTLKLASKVIDLADPSISYGALSERSPYQAQIPESNHRFENAYQLAIKAKTHEDRIKAVENIATVIEDETLIVPLFQRYVLYRSNPKTIKSLGNQSKPLFIDLSLVEMH
jgi:ABC-type transport system substrate-binding protein